MYAVIQSGGKQLRVKKGEVVEVEKLSGDVGSNCEFGEVLLVAKQSDGNDSVTETWLGTPQLDKAKVTGKIVGQGRGKKTKIFKMKRRKDYHRTLGHRQELTHVLITGIDNGKGLSDALSDSDVKTLEGKFKTPLKPKGPARQAKTQGSRERVRRAKGETKKPAAKKAAATTSKKASKKAKKASKKAASKKAKKKTTKKTK